MDRTVQGSFLERGIYLIVLQKCLDESLVPRTLASGFSDLDAQPKVKSEWSCLLFHEVPSWRRNVLNGEQCGYRRQRECPDSFCVEVTAETLDRPQ
jgi:hypothetical protein